MEFQVSSRRENRQRNTLVIKGRVLQNVLANNFAVSDAEDNTWAVEQRRCSRFAFVENTISNMQNVRRANFLRSDVLFCFFSLSRIGSFTSLSELCFRFRRFILLLQTKKVVFMNYGSSTSSWKPWRWGLTQYLHWGIYTSIPTWTTHKIH